MKDDKNKSILKEAILNSKEIMNAADVNAKKKLAEEFPDKFNNLLKKELTNKKTKGYNKVEETVETETTLENNINLKENESVMKKNTKKTEKINETELPIQIEEFDITELDISNVGTALENAEEDDEIITLDEIENEISNMEDLEGELNELFGDNLSSKIKQLDPSDVNGIQTLFNKAFQNILTNPNMGIIGRIAKSTPPEDKLAILNQYAENNGGTLRTSGNKLTYAPQAVKDASTTFAAKGRHRLGEEEEVENNEIENDEVENNEIENDEIENSEIDVNDEKLDNDSDDAALNDLVGLREKLDQIIKSLGDDEEIEIGNDDDENLEVDLGAIEQEIDEMYKENAITDDDVDQFMGSDEELDEIHGVDYAKRRNMASRGHNPNPKNLSKIEKDQSPENFQESRKKIVRLIEENKKITKQLNDGKKFKKSVNELVEGYKNALQKYKNQLKEMAIFNTNLANVNNLFINEDLALTQEDKITIINEFKKIDTIANSQKKYQSFLTEMKDTKKKTISESIENKVSTSIQPSSKQKLDEVIEKTAYASNDHLKRVREIIKYVEKR